jgi:RNA polymerase sigma factor (TIGR02999 family)
MTNVTQMLESIREGDPQAADRLLPLVYDELRRIAASKMAHEASSNTLQPTALVHEAWLRMVGDGNERFDGRAHFFAVAADPVRFCRANWRVPRPNFA